MKTNKLGFLGLLAIIAFNYALMEKSPLQFIKKDAPRSLAGELAISVPSTSEVVQAAPVTIEILGTISSTKDLNTASDLCFSHIEKDITTSGSPKSTCYFTSKVCGTDITNNYEIDLGTASKLNADKENLTTAEKRKNTKEYVLTKITEGYKSVTNSFCAKKTAEAPASKTDTTETAKGLLPSIALGKANTDVAQKTAEVVKEVSIREECTAIRKNVKSDRRSRRSATVAAETAASRYANRSAKTSRPETRDESQDEDLTEELIADAEYILFNEDTTKSELSHCLDEFRKSKNNTLKNIAKDYKTAKKHEEKIAKEVENSLSNYDLAAAKINQNQSLCLQQAQIRLSQSTIQQPQQNFNQPQFQNQLAQIQQNLQNLNQGAQQAYQTQVSACNAQYNTNILTSQYSNGLNNYLTNSSQYVQSKVQSSSILENYRSWVRTEISAVQNALGYNTQFTNPSFVPGTTQRTFDTSSLTNIQQPVISPSVANPNFAPNTVPGTRTLSTNSSVTGVYTQTPQVALPNFAAPRSGASVTVPTNRQPLVRR